MKVLGITQARYGSTRLPAKILKEVNGQTLLEIHLSRILQSKLISKLKIATTDEEGSKYIVAIADKVGVEYHKGSVDDVLSRFYETAETEMPDYVVRLTSDCPLIDPKVIDETIQFCIDNNCDYARTDAACFPDGLDTEVFKFSALVRAYNEADLTSEREHVTPYIWKNSTAWGGQKFTSKKLRNKEGVYEASEYRITIDEPEDYLVIKELVEVLGTDKGWKEYINYLLTHDEIKSINSKFGYNEGYEKSIKNDKIISK